MLPLTETFPCVIDGDLVLTDSSIDVADPATGDYLASIARGGEQEIERAVAAARAASDGWRRTPVTTRAGILRRIGALISANRELLARLESRDTGKPLSQAYADVDVATRYFDYYASTVEAFFGTSYPPNGDLSAITRHEPFGVTGHIIPWNYPLQIASRTIAPAIAVGNCSVVKPAEDASLTVIQLAVLALEAGLPPGVLNVVPGLGSEAGASLAGSPGIDHLSFTGSVPVGISVACQAAANVVPVALELGGKSPNIVFCDADIDSAVPIILKSFLQNAGQTCSAGSRLLVHESVESQLLEGLESAVRAVRIGPGLQDPDLGPLISARQLNRVTAMVERATADCPPRIGGPERIVTPSSGYFFPPTVFANVDASSAIAQEEVFGPVVAATTFSSLEEAITLANATDFGLIAAIWTRDIDTAHVAAEGIRAGQLYVNNYGAGGGVEYPFGGFRKSGYGREKGFDALAGMCQTKTIITKIKR